MKSNLSKSERKYRIKFIQECHYDKTEQQIFDEAKLYIRKSYKEMYCFMRSGQIYSFMMSIANNRLGRVIYNCGVSTERMTENLRAFSKAIIKSEEVLN